MTFNHRITAVALAALALSACNDAPPLYGPDPVCAEYERRTVEVCRRVMDHNDYTRQECRDVRKRVCVRYDDEDRGRGGFIDNGEETA